MVGTPDYPQGFIDLRYAVDSLQRDVIRNEKVIEKLSEAVEKIEEMNANLCKMIALHELKHDTVQKALGQIDDDFHDMTERIDDTFIKTSKLVTPATEVKLMNSSHAQDTTDVKKFMQDVYRLAYMFLGAAVVIGYLLGHTNWSALVQIFSPK